MKLNLSDGFSIRLHSVVQMLSVPQGSILSPNVFIYICFPLVTIQYFF